MNTLEENQTGILVVTVGALIRKTIRKFLDRSKIFTYSEDKNMIDSIFTIRGPLDKLEELKIILKRWED